MYIGCQTEVKNKDTFRFLIPALPFSTQRLRFQIFVAEWDSGIQTAKPQTEKLPLLSFFQLLSDDDNWKRNFLDFPLCRCAPYDKFAGVEMRQMEHLLHFLPFISISTLIRLSSIQQVLNGFKFWLFGFFFLERKGPSLHWKKDECLEGFEECSDLVVRLCSRKIREDA